MCVCQLYPQLSNEILCEICMSRLTLFARVGGIWGSLKCRFCTEHICSEALLITALNTSVTFSQSVRVLHVHKSGREMFHLDVLVMPLECVTHSAKSPLPGNHDCLSSCWRCLVELLVQHKASSDAAVLNMHCAFFSILRCFFPNMSVMGAFRAEYQQIRGLAHGIPVNSRDLFLSAVQ